MSPTLLIVQGISLAAIFLSALLLRSAAEKARATAAKHLTEKLIAARGEQNEAAKGDKNDHRAEQLELLLDRVNSLQEGAFARWSSQPLVKAVLLPLLTYGGTVLLQLYGLPGLE